MCFAFYADVKVLSDVMSVSAIGDEDLTTECARAISCRDWSVALYFYQLARCPMGLISADVFVEQAKSNCQGRQEIWSKIKGLCMRVPKLFMYLCSAITDSRIYQESSNFVRIGRERVQL